VCSLRLPAALPASEGIVLRPFCKADIAMLRNLATDPYVPLIGSLPANASESDALDFIERQNDRRETATGYSFCVPISPARLWGPLGCGCRSLRGPSNCRLHGCAVRKTSRYCGPSASGADLLRPDPSRSISDRVVRRALERRLDPNRRDSWIRPRGTAPQPPTHRKSASRHAPICNTATSR